MIAAGKEDLLGLKMLLVNTPPLDGKIALLPLALPDEDWLKEQKNVLMEHRRQVANAFALYLLF